MNYQPPKRGESGPAPTGVPPPARSASPNSAEAPPWETSAPAPSYPPAKPPNAPLRVPPKAKPAGSGSYVQHPKYGRGQVLRREGDGDQAKLTVMFPGHGIKKLVEKFAGLLVYL